MWDYTDTVKDHFRHPRNIGVIENADGVGEVGSLACGDALKLTFKLDDKQNIIDAKFQTFGCASAIASSSALTEMIKGMSLEEASKVTNQHIAEFLGGLPEQKMHCSVMGREALELAIENYRTGEPQHKELEGNVICACFGVTQDEIERVVRENDLTSVDDVTHYCKAGGGCGQCKDDIAKIIAEVRGTVVAEVKPESVKKPLTNIQRIKLIGETIENEIRPMLQQDGGDIELIDVEGVKVLVALRGACAKCRMAEFTMKDVVEARLRDFVSPDIVVEEVKA